MFKKASVLLLVIILILSTFAGCQNGTIDSTKHQQDVTEQKKDIVIALDSTFTSMDPHDSNNNVDFSVQKSMMQGLFGFDKDMKVIPVLAESYVSNEAATEFTFKLRQGVRFHDGTPFNAEAVKENIDRLANQENKLKRNSLFEMVDRTAVIDEYTVKIILKAPFGAMINTLAHPAAMMHSPAALRKYGKDVSRNPVGTGPFKFKEWVPGDHVTVVKNDDYWRPGYPKVDSITFKPVTENGTRIAMLQAGEADFILPVPYEQVDLISRDKNIVLEVTPSIGVRHISMNTMKKPFDDIRVRKALNYAIDKEAYIKVVHSGLETISDSIIAPNTQFYAKQAPYEYDIEKAKELLKEAGYEKGFKVQIWARNSSDDVRGMEFIQQQLAKINVNVEVVPMESGTLSERLSSAKKPEDAEVQLYYRRWPPSTGDADWGIRPLFATASLPPKSSNYAYYSNVEADSLIDQGIKTADPKLRSEVYKKAQEIIWNDAPWIFLSVSEFFAGMQADVSGIYTQPDGIISVEEAEIK